MWSNVLKLATMMYVQATCRLCWSTTNVIQNSLFLTRFSSLKQHQSCPNSVWLILIMETIFWSRILRRHDEFYRLLKVAIRSIFIPSFNLSDISLYCDGQKNIHKAISLVRTNHSPRYKHVSSCSQWNTTITLITHILATYPKIASNDFREKLLTYLICLIDCLMNMQLHLYCVYTCRTTFGVQ